MSAHPWPQLIGHDSHLIQVGPMGCSPGRLDYRLGDSKSTWLLSETEFPAPGIHMMATLCHVSGVQGRPVFDEMEELVPHRRLPGFLEALQALDLPLTELSLLF